MAGERGDVSLTPFEAPKAPEIAQTALILKGRLNSVYIIGLPGLAGGFSS